MFPSLCAAAGRLDGVVPVSGGVENGVPHMPGIATLHAAGCPVAGAHAFDSAAAASARPVPFPNTVPFAAPPRESQRLFPNDPGADSFSTRARWACRWALYFGRMSPHQHTTQRTPSSYHVSTVLNARVVGLVEPVWSEWLAWSVWSEWLVSEWLLDHAR